MDGVPDASAWVTFGQVASVVIFLAALFGALAAWKKGFFQRRDGAPAPVATEGVPTYSGVLAELQRAQGELAGHSGRVGDLEVDRTELRSLQQRLGDAEKSLSGMRLHVAENYISREDWVPMTSRVIGMLEEHTALLARLDERSRQHHGG